MAKRKTNYLILLWPLIAIVAHLSAATPFEPTKDLPISYQGRFRSLDSAARFWLHEITHRHSLKKSDMPVFQLDDASALNLMWNFHFSGHKKWDHAPLFWIHYAAEKELLGLPASEDRFSFNVLSNAIYEDRDINLKVMRRLLPYEFAKAYLAFSNRTQSEKIELQSLTPGLWLALRGDDLIIAAAPENAPWNFLKSGMTLLPNARDDLNRIVIEEKLIADELMQLFQSLYRYAENKSAELKMLPSRFDRDWVSLHALKKSTNNFTFFSDEHFARVRNAYLAIEKAFVQPDAGLLESAVNDFSEAFSEGYASLAGTPYKEAFGKQLMYPSLLQLNAETIYSRLPLIEIAIAAYAIALVLFLFSSISNIKAIKYCAIAFLLLGFAVHSAILVLRWFILQRPPVSNMFETIIYVPWIALMTGFLFYGFFRIKAVLIASCIASLALLILLKLAYANPHLDNVQAVLDSQYWLIVHVLMVVGSYGAFIVSGILGHFFLIASLLRQQTLNLAKGILYSMYLGVCLLIPGTILGGVWAAESWGRFWDWDPKESWAFISACVYLLVIHAYTFQKIKDFGLAVGAILGLTAISFTWYGVNYILGTGLHSYGFGNGGEGYYFLYLFAEALFLGTISVIHIRQENQ